MIFGIRIITDDIDRLVAFYERITGETAARPNPFFAELKLPTGLLAFASPATVGMLGDAAPRPGGNQGVVVEFLVDDADAVWADLEDHVDDVVQPPATMPWGNRSVVFRDPDGNVVNLFARPRG